MSGAMERTFAFQQRMTGLCAFVFQFHGSQCPRILFECISIDWHLHASGENGNSRFAAAAGHFAGEKIKSGKFKFVDYSLLYIIISHTRP
jgi:hypothetical protein